MGNSVKPCIHSLLTCWLLGICWPLLGPCWAPVGSLLGPCWALLGPCWPPVGPLLAPCWVPVGPLLGPCWPLLGPCWVPVGPLLGPYWPLLAPQTLTIKADLIDCLIGWLVVQAKQGLRGEEAAGRLDLLGSNALPYKATSWARLFVDECFRL